jgi:predicted RNA methylase
MKSDEASSAIVLKRGNRIDISIESTYSVHITVNQHRHLFSNYALAILGAFTQPRPLNEVLKNLPVNGIADWMEITSTIAKLRKIGALTEHGKTPVTADKNPESFGSAPVHIGMLNDKIRTDAFINAIKATVKPGDVVLDIGTGTGILAIAAARAGASKVYAIEAGTMADIAEETIAETEVASRIVLIRGWSTQITLPEKADVLVSEIIGNDPFGENILQTFNDAHRRLLKAGARVIPSGMALFGLPARIAPSLIKNRILQSEELDNWKNWYGIDFKALNKTSVNLSQSFLRINTNISTEIEIFDEPVLLADVDFNTIAATEIKHKVSVQSQHSFNGLMLYFTLTLTNASLTSKPHIAGRARHWLNPVWYIPEASNLAPGSDLDIEYRYTQGKNSEIHVLNKDKP